MSTPTNRRQSRRSCAIVSYEESPANSPNLSAKKKFREFNPESQAKTPKSSGKSIQTMTDHEDTPKRGRGRPRKSVAQKSDESQMLVRNVPKAKSVHESDEESPAPKTPKSSRKSVRKAAEDSPAISPKKLRSRTPTVKCLESIVSESSPTVNQLESSLGRGQRVKTPNNRYSTGCKKTPKKNTSAEVIDLSLKELSLLDELTAEDDSIEDFQLAKPTTLFDNDVDVEGQKMYSFKTPSKKDSMATLAQQTPKTPKGTPKTPKNLRLSEIQNTPTSRSSASKLTKTPRHVREANKKGLAMLRAQLSESDGDFSASASEYEESEEESSQDSSDDDQENTTPPKKPVPVASRILKTPSVAASSGPVLRRSARSKVDPDFVFQSDHYFSAASTKTKTSDHTLDRLKNPRMPQDQLVKLLSNMQLSKEHELAIKSLNKEYKFYFDKWLTLFDEGYTVLLHGYGSKRNLMQAFHKEKLADRHVIVINGFFPSLTIKDILDTVWVDMLEMTAVGGNPHEIVNLIEEKMKKIPALHIFLMIHNIDGAMLRNDKAQSVLSRLASVKNIHMIASIDHINTPLLWNHTKLSNFNFVWFDVTSFLPYTDETAFDSSLLTQNSGALELSSMKSVFQSLTSNARGIYINLIKYQLKNSGNPNYQGMSFKELYSSCREAFLVSSDVALRAQLTEFLDHKLAKMKRTIDGSESITIPIKNALLEQFLNEQL